jgi:hypothetical protein
MIKRSLSCRGKSMKLITHPMSQHSAHRRRLCLGLTALLTAGLAACQPTAPTPTEGKTMTLDKKEVVYFDVSLFSYLDRPIFDVYLNGTDVGVAGPFSGGMGAGGGLMTGVAVPLGAQVVTWRLGGPEGMHGNGDTVKAINQPILTRPDPKLTYLGVHIYPDNTVELIPEASWPETSAKGNALAQEWRKKHGQ